ncbi:hypothetical protein PybrP1_011612 [[Pythium] brassicae (nom. inval.)]|nr:hypothetical protein PybrP1_011612 [[Pythium] brassicae (nom. inval.)]
MGWRENCLRRDLHDRPQVVFMDNAGGHKTNAVGDDELEKKRITFRYLPPNNTNLCHLADANII